jgi:membrane peptidoglycan carboxypeptidase
MTDMLQAVVQQGTGRAAMLDRPTGGKTGTSQDFRDAWFVGFTADYTAGVWLGNDNGEPMERVTGGNLPARIWHDVMMEAERGLPSKALPGAPTFMDLLPSFLTGRSSGPPPTQASSSPAATTYKPLLNLDPYNRPGAAPPP